MTRQPETIHTPLSRRIQTLRRGVAPVLVWVVAVVVVVTLAGRSTRRIDAVGVAESRVVTVAPLVDGTLQGLSVELFDHTEADQIVGLIDDTLVRAQLVTAQAELSRLGADLEARRAELALESIQRELDDLNDQRRFVLNEEQARLAYLDRVVQQESDKVELNRLALVLGRQKRLIEQDAGDEATYDDVRLQHAALAKRIDENVEALEAARRRMDEAGRRWADRVADRDAVDMAQILRPLHEAVTVQHGRILELTEQRKMLVLRAPLAGTVAHIFHRAGETVPSGDPVLAIAAESSRRVLAYVDERSAERVSVGAPVEVATRGYPRNVMRGQVVKVSAAIEEVPIRLRRNPLFSEWGLAILVGDIPSDALRPGQALDVRFLNSN